MRRFLRRIPAFVLALLSLVCVPLFLVVLILYPRSYFAADSFWFNGHNHVRAFISNTGHLQFNKQRLKPTAPYTIVANTGRKLGQEPHDPRPAFRESTFDRRISFAGFGYARVEDEYAHRRVMIVPFWFVLLVLAAPPVLLIVHVRRIHRRHRLAHNLCVRCAYDLRASPDRCPECGHTQPRFGMPAPSASAHA